MVEGANNIEVGKVASFFSWGSESSDHFCDPGHVLASASRICGMLRKWLTCSVFTCLVRNGLGVDDHC